MDYTPETLRKLPYVPRLHEEDIIAHADAWEANIERLEAGIGEYQNAMLKWLDEEKALRKRLEEAEEAMAINADYIRQYQREIAKWESIYGKWPGGPALNTASLTGEDKARIRLFRSERDAAEAQCERLCKKLEEAEKFIRWLPREAWDVGDGPKLRRAALAKEEK